MSRAPAPGRSFFTLLVLLSADAVSAQAPTAVAAPSLEEPVGEETERIEVTWSDIVRLVDRDPRLAIGRSLRDAARADVDDAGAAPNPTLEGEFGWASPRDGSEADIEWGLSLTVPLGWIAQRGSLVDAARADADAAEAGSEALRREALLELAVLYWSLVHAQANTASLEALETQTVDLVESVRARVEKGESRPAEVVRAEIELDRVSADLEVARASVSARRAELALWLREPLGKAVVAVADLEDLPAEMDRDSALSRVRAHHPALEQSHARTRASESRLLSERRARAPAFALTGFVSSELDARGYGVGISIDLPLWNWNAGRIAAAEAQLAASRSGAELDRLALETAVIESQAACHASVATARRFRVGIVPRSASVAASAERTYALGEASLLEVIDARRNLLESRRRYLDALLQSRIECDRLGSLVGEETK